MQRTKPIKVSILATRYTTPSTLYGLYDLLSSVGVSWEATVSGKPANPQFEVTIVAKQREPFACARGVVISPKLTLNEATNAEIVVIPSHSVPNTNPLKGEHQDEIEWIIREHDRGSVITSACTGLLVLAESGLLDGFEATTHWAFADLVRRNYPKIQLNVERNLCSTGINNQIITSGGTTAWQELGLYLITRYCGREHASHVAKFWAIHNRTESQMVFSEMLKVPEGDDRIIDEAREWVSQHFSNRSPVKTMVTQSGLSSTTFTRRFKRATGYRPLEYTHLLRIHMAKTILETSRTSVEKISLDVGYEDLASFRRIFKREVGMTPGEYRRKLGQSRFERYEQL